MRRVVGVRQTEVELSGPGFAQEFCAELGLLRGRAWGRGIEGEQGQQGMLRVLVAVFHDLAEGGAERRVEIGDDGAEAGE